MNSKLQQLSPMPTEQTEKMVAIIIKFQRKEVFWYILLSISILYLLIEAAIFIKHAAIDAIILQPTIGKSVLILLSMFLSVISFFRRLTIEGKIKDLNHELKHQSKGTINQIKFVKVAP